MFPLEKIEKKKKMLMRFTYMEVNILNLKILDVGGEVIEKVGEFGTNSIFFFPPKLKIRYYPLTTKSTDF